MRSFLIVGLLFCACGDDTGTPVGSGGNGGTSGSGGMSGSGGSGGNGGMSGGGGNGGMSGSGGSGGVAGSGGTGGTGGTGIDGGPIACGAGGSCPSGMLCCPCTGMCYSQGCLACCMFCRQDAGTTHDCTSGICNRCQNGICCGQNCCQRGEWCDQTNPQNPVCRCGDTGMSCTSPQTCCSGLPGPGGGACGSFCGQICPAAP